MKTLEQRIDSLFQKGLLQNIAVRVALGDKPVLEFFRSAPEYAPVTSKTLFDMASVTKIMVTTPLALMALERSEFTLDTPAASFFPGETRADITIRHLLTHTMGIGHKPLNIPGNTYDNIASYIFSIPSDVPVGSEVLYSCPGYILLGKILEKIYGERLDQAFYHYVAAPLGLTSSFFKPDGDAYSIVPSSVGDDRPGIVNDYNCRYLGGVAGNAGLFSCLDDVTRYAGMMRALGEPLMKRETFLAAVRLQTAGLKNGTDADRALGYVAVTERYRQTGRLFAPGSVGHCGHTGQSLFVNLDTGLTAIILTDATVSTIRTYGNEHYNEVCDMRALLHNAIASDLEDLVL